MNDTAEQQSSRIAPWEWLSLVALMIAGCALRLWCASRAPGLWYDEAIYGLDSLDVARKPHYWPIFFATEGHMREPLFMYIQAITLSFVPPSAFAIRATSAVIGTLTIPVLWAAAREYRGALFAMFAAFLFTFLRWHVHFSALAFRTITAPLLLAFVVWFALRFARTRRLRDAVLLGVFLGIGLYTYLAFRLVPIAIAIFLLIEVVKTKGLERIQFFKRCAIAVAVSLVVFAPLGIDFIKHPEHFRGRSDEVTIFDHADWPRLLLKQTRDVALSPLLRGDHVGKQNIPGPPRFLQLFDQDPVRVTELWDLDRPRRGAPPLDPHGTGVPTFGISGGLMFYLGFACALWRFGKDRAARLWIITVLVGSLASILSFGAPNLLRLLFLTPICAILLADGFTKLCQWMNRLGAAIGARSDPPRSGGWISSALTVIVVGNVLFFHLWTEGRRLYVWPTHPKVRREFNLELADLAEYLAKQPDRLPVRLPAVLMSDEHSALPTIRFIADGYTFNPPDDKLGDRWWEFRSTIRSLAMEEKGVRVPGGRTEEIFLPVGVTMGMLVEVAPRGK
ncbi:MAG TPA: glycosyltransferase family 39 protein [Candidatus Sumerlaeota bacterium]|nr:glycosyltransferase family 39 protein [Candidatus Sumerlaeota bacterium]